MIYYKLLLVVLSIIFCSLSTQSSRPKIIRARSPKLSTSNVACSKTNLVTIINFQQPFNGIVYAKGYSQECQIDGNGSKILKFESSIHNCGIKMIEINGLEQYEVHLYVQYGKHIQQSIDERILVRCAPYEILLSGGMGRRTDELKPQSPNLKSMKGESKIQIKPMNNHHFAESTFGSVECWMDILKGRIPYLKTIDGYVNIGEDITVLVKIKKMLGIDTRLSKCFAHDRSQTTKFELTNENGCSLDEMIMPNFKEFTNELKSSKIFYTTFPAFKFPDRSNLHIQCTVVVCNTTCPKFDCDVSNETSTGLIQRRKRYLNNKSTEKLKKPENVSLIIRHKSLAKNWTMAETKPIQRFFSKETIVSRIGVSNVVDVSEDVMDSSKSYKSRNFDGSFSSNSCFFSSTFMIYNLILIIFLMAAILGTIYFCLMAKRFQKKLCFFESCSKFSTLSSRKYFSHPLHEAHNFAYGRMVDLTQIK